MGYKSTEEMISSFREFANGLQKIPTSFSVHNDYLIDGVTESEFIKGYKAYRDLLFDLHTDMCENPDDYGMFTTDKKTIKNPLTIIIILICGFSSPRRKRAKSKMIFYM